MTVHVFVDESKARGYLLAAAAIEPKDVSQARKHIAALHLPGQPRIHFAKERVSRRRAIVDVFADLPIAITLYDAPNRASEHAARKACIEQLVPDLAKLGARSLVIEQDDSLIDSDRRLLYSCVRAAGCDETLRYEHTRAHNECLLAIPDGVAWCWTKGGDWKRRASGLVAEVVRL
jgi:hypothetical protein